jgi:PhnB protein
VDALTIQPWLTVTDADAAVTFYEQSLGARRGETLADEGGGVVVAELILGGATFWVQDDADAPVGDGRPIRLILVVDDPDTLVDRAVGAGARLVNPVGEENGWRVGRIVDPFGVHWEIGRRLDA